MKRSYLYSVFSILVIFASLSDAYSQRWEKVGFVFPSSYLNAKWKEIYFLPSDTRFGWVCGTGGNVGRTTDGGDSWNVVQMNGLYHPECIFFADQNNGFMSGLEGIFKSTNGGAAWTEISPTDTATFFGCYFFNKSEGIVIGEGCYKNQMFWRTRDAGANWELFETKEPNSGMADLTMDGSLGYAVSSGRYWVTKDRGATWTIEAITGTTDAWHGDIAKIDATIILPLAGTQCEGGGGGGQIRVSNDEGLSWKSYPMSAPMWGSCLITASEGWACGYDRAVYHTTNGGASWQLSNCGLGYGDFEDIVFINPDKGFVVGDGIYKLAPTTFNLSKPSVDFASTCYPAIVLDTLILYNRGFFNGSVELNISGTDANEFEIIEPITNPTLINPCSELMIITKMTPTSPGIKSALLTMKIGTKIMTIPIKANVTVPQAYTEKAEYIFQKLSLNTPTQARVVWLSPVVEKVNSIYKNKGDSVIKLVTTAPLTINTKAFSDFEIALVDTGWFSAEFGFNFAPCNIAKFVTIKAYGVSPIIHSLDSLSVKIICSNEKTVAIPVDNYGNDDLIISSLFLSGNKLPKYSFKWKSSNNLPVTIKPKSSDTLFITFTELTAGIKDFTLEIINNDSTLKRGKKNPYKIPIRIETASTNIVSAVTQLDFGKICSGTLPAQKLVIKNLGNLDAVLLPAKLKTNAFKVINYKTALKANDSMIVDINFTPSTPGTYTDTLTIESQPCGETLKIALNAELLYSEMTINPQKLNVYLQTGAPVDKSIFLSFQGLKKVTITKVIINPIPTGLNINYIPLVPKDMNPGDNLEFKFNFISNLDTIFKFNICFETNDSCLSKLCVPVELSSKLRNIAINTDSIYFGNLYCSSQSYTSKVIISNIAGVNDTITKIDLTSDGSYSITNKPALPYPLKTGEQIILDVLYKPNAIGTHSGSIAVESIGPGGQNLDVALFGQYYTPSISPIDTLADLGSIEKCDAKRKITYKIFNNGVASDTIQAYKPTVSGFTTNCPSLFVIAPNSYYEVEVDVDPAFLAAGTNNYKIDFTDICGTAFTVNAKVQLIKSNLTIRPTTLSFDNVWYESTTSQNVNVENNGQTNIAIESMKLIGNADNLFTLGSYPSSIAFGSNFNVPVTFVANKEGVFQVTLRVVYSSACQDSIDIVINADVPSEVYYPKFVIGKYFNTPGDSINVSIKLDTAIVRLITESVSIDLAFDRNLLYPIELLYKPTNEIIPFTKTAKKISFVLDKTQSGHIFESKGEVFSLRALVLASMPDTTSISIDSVKISANRKSFVSSENGFLTLTGICKFTAGLKYNMLPTISIEKITTKNDNVLSIDILSDGEQSAELFMTDAAGRIYKLDDIFVGKGTFHYEKRLADLPSGLLLIKLINFYGWQDNEKIIIVK